MKIERTQIHFYGTFSPPSRPRRILGPVYTYPFFVFENGDFFLQFNLTFRSHVSGENSFLVQLEQKSPGPRIRIFDEIFLDLGRCVNTPETTAT